MENTYNGYKNYQTWNVALWLQNSEWQYDHYQSEVARLLRFEEKEDATKKLADIIQSDIEQEFDSLHLPGVFADIFGHTLHKVEWEEVAAVFIEE